MKHLLTRFVLPLLVATFAWQSTAMAGVVGTEAMLQAEAAPHADDRQTIDAMLARDNVRAQMQALGIDPAVAEERVAGLSDAEAAHLAANIEDAAAGGDALAVVGVVFVVLLILEAVGVTDVFKAI
ncbi:PA2779 family protein [Algiphilus sp.]|uniref:PA2779 family protein n=1 Tax=Algiphilus sp. TaxID=1872431 RepID=UPI001CA6E942|nr:PA2779 family protein [Algiphilus sp.]MBY8966917.1 PA2779 family protein [Algiphilus acroporae]MCI5062378.1 PA2779 family protein [Algiphilus sp.]MCI5103585.1 PA2779 family protein [Algiphilus sp.]MCR9091622.1 PA2779 family protein [Pseudomonadota bacterium]